VLGEEVALAAQARKLQQVLHQLGVLVAEGGQDDDVVLQKMRGGKGNKGGGSGAGI
jgi:hypothetical protein